jgi:hypothetical protein
MKMLMLITMLVIGAVASQAHAAWLLKEQAVILEQEGHPDVACTLAELTKETQAFTYFMCQPYDDSLSGLYLADEEGNLIPVEVSEI